MRRRVWRVGMWAGLAIALVLGLAWGLSLRGPVLASRGGIAAGLEAGRLRAAWGPGRVEAQKYGWSVATPEGSDALLMPRPSAWRPDAEGAAVNGGALWAVYVPLWPLVVLAGCVAGGCWWMAGPRRRAGCCGRCGYDLSGLGGGRCPECGGVVRRFVGAVWRAMMGRGVAAGGL